MWTKCYNNSGFVILSVGSSDSFFRFLQHLETTNQTKGETDYAQKAFMELSIVEEKFSK